MERVPYELVRCIFAFLALKDLVRCRLVCLAWYRAVNSLPPIVWDQIVERYPGGKRPNSKKARRVGYSEWVTATMRTFFTFMQKQQYEKALRWACNSGHHALILEMIRLVLLPPPSQFCKTNHA